MNLHTSYNFYTFPFLCLFIFILKNLSFQRSLQSNLNNLLHMFWRYYNFTETYLINKTRENSNKSNSLFHIVILLLTFKFIHLPDFCYFHDGVIQMQSNPIPVYKRNSWCANSIPDEFLHNDSLLLRCKQIKLSGTQPILWCLKFLRIIYVDIFN